MKYWDKLRSLEDQIIRLHTIESILRCMGNSQPTTEDTFNLVWHIHDQVEEINKKANESFFKLWEEIRNDSYKKNTFEYCTPTQSSNELMNIVNSWVKQ